MRRARIVTVLSSLLGAAALATACTAASVAGRAAWLDGSPAAGVTIAISSGPLGSTVTTAQDGSFRFAGLQPGRYAIAATASGRTFQRVPDLVLAPGEDRRLLVAEAAPAPVPVLAFEDGMLAIDAPAGRTGSTLSARIAIPGLKLPGFSLFGRRRPATSPALAAAAPATSVPAPAQAPPTPTAEPAVPEDDAPGTGDAQWLEWLEELEELEAAEGADGDGEPVSVEDAEPWDDEPAWDDEETWDDEASEEAEPDAEPDEWEGVASASKSRTRTLAASARVAGASSSAGPGAGSPWVGPLEAPVTAMSIGASPTSWARARELALAASARGVDGVPLLDLAAVLADRPSAPASGGALAVRAHLVACPWAPSRRLLRVALDAPAPRAAAARPPLHVVMLVEAAAGPAEGPRRERFDVLARRFVDLLRDDDTLAVVAYPVASIVLRPTAARQRDHLLDALASVGATAPSASGTPLDIARAMAAAGAPDAQRSLVVVSAGSLELGPAGGDELLRAVAKLRERDVRVCVLALGDDDSGDADLRQLADRGEGRFARVRSAIDAERAAAREALGSVMPAASDVGVEIAWNPQRVARWRRAGQGGSGVPADAAPREVLPGHHAEALFEIEPTPRGGAGPLARVRLRWRVPGESEVRRIDHLVLDAPVEPPAADEPTRFAVALATLERLARPEEPRAATLALAARLLRDGSRPPGARSEVAAACERAALAAVPAAGATLPVARR